MSLTRRKTGLAFTILLVCILLGAAWYVFPPSGLPSAELYFVNPSVRELQEDEVGQLKATAEMYFRMSNRGDDFEGWNTARQEFWKYAIAFAAYGIPSAMIIDPENYADYAALFDSMIWKMKSRKVWGDYTDRGFGADPITMQNIMYKGHLNLMYGLFQLTTGDMRYAREYTWLTKQIAQEMRMHHQGRYEGVTCEPHAWFVECNTVGMLSLHIYDKLYATHYTENEVQWSLDFIAKRMTDPDTGLFYSSYNPSLDSVRKNIRGYANAWILMFLNPFMPEEMQALYPTFKEELALDYGPFSSIRFEINEPANTTAHVFGLWAAKEFHDTELFTGLRNTTDILGRLGKDTLHGGLTYAGADAQILNGFVTAAKLHVGWRTILEHNWGRAAPYNIPDTTGMTWTDLLPTQIYEMNAGRNPLPLQSPTDRPCPSCYWGSYQSEYMLFQKSQSETIKSKQACSHQNSASCGLESLNKP